MFNVLGKGFTMFFSKGANSSKVFRMSKEMGQVFLDLQGVLEAGIAEYAKTSSQQSLNAGRSWLLDGAGKGHGVFEDQGLAGGG